jgi:hypothetical protein
MLSRDRLRSKSRWVDDATTRVPVHGLLGCFAIRHSSLCVPKTLSELMTWWNRLSWRNDRAALFLSGRPGLAIQVEVAA